MHAQHDTKQTTRAAREAFRSKWERDVDPDGVLPPEERARRAHALFRAHMTVLSLKASLARSKRAA
jgi:hypothetical protein